MRPFGILICLFLCLSALPLWAQVSPDCINAVPICSDTPINGGVNGYGIDDFNGASRTGCFKQDVGTVESNSAWYRFRTGASGQLGFNIGFDASEDWDFALYKTDDCDNLGEPVRCNFFDNRHGDSFTGVGEDPTGSTDSARYDDWLYVDPGEDYYLLINNYSNNNSGFSIQFSGQIFVANPNDALDCSIVSNLLGPPISACENDNVILDATTDGAFDYNWFKDTGNGFESISGENGSTLQATFSGYYRVVVVMPSGNNIISEVQVAFSALPSAFPVTDETLCDVMSPFDLRSKDGEALGVQDSNKFIVSYHASLSDAINGVDHFPKQYVTNVGSQTVYVRVTSLENAKCFDVSQQFELTVLETPVLDFPYETYICEDGSSVTIGEASPNPDYAYIWSSGENTPSIVVSQAGVYTLTATNAQNGISCSNNAIVTVIVSKPPAIADVHVEDLQSNNTVTIETDISGDFEYQLNDGEFQSSNIFTNVLPGMHRVTVNDPKGCGSATEQIVVVGFPAFFTPNGDGINDEWTVMGLSSLENPVISIYDRFGKLLKQIDGASLGWDGTYNGRNLPSADYWFKLTYTDSDQQRTTAKYINNHFSLRR